MGDGADSLIPERELIRAEDKDSIKWGTASTGGARSVYFNSVSDTLDEIKRRIDLENDAVAYATGAGKD